MDSDNSSQHNMTSSQVEEIDHFSFFLEGVGIMIVGWLGVIGNSCSVYLFSKQKVHRVFHRLLLCLAIFDLLYVVCSLLMFSMPKFSQDFDFNYRVYMLPYLLPLAHIGLLGSVYCTLTLTIERFLAVCYPFLKHRRAYTSKAFILPVTIFTLVYNLPKFFELKIEKQLVQDLESSENCTDLSIGNNCSSEASDLQDDNYYYVLVPTALRTNALYVRIYILWSNMIVQIVIPFILLIILNVRTYQKIKEFEQNLSQQSKVFSASSRVNRCSSNNSQKVMFADLPSEDATSTRSRSSFRGSLKTFTQSFRRMNKAKGGGNVRNNVVADNVHDSRKREVVLAKVSLYMVFVFLVCHSVKIVPNVYEMVQTYYFTDFQPGEIPWPGWVSKVTNASHFLLTLACSANFFIYFVKHSTKMQRLISCNRKSNNAAHGSDPDEHDRDSEVRMRATRLSEDIKEEVEVTSFTPTEAARPLMSTSSDKKKSSLKNNKNDKGSPRPPFPSVTMV